MERYARVSRVHTSDIKFASILMCLVTATISSNAIAKRCSRYDLQLLHLAGEFVCILRCLVDVVQIPRLDEVGQCIPLSQQWTDHIVVLEYSTTCTQYCSVWPGIKWIRLCDFLPENAPTTALVPFTPL
jgi:hypothetical protein